MDLLAFQDTGLLAGIIAIVNITTTIAIIIVIWVFLAVLPGVATSVIVDSNKSISDWQFLYSSPLSFLRPPTPLLSASASYQTTFPACTASTAVVRYRGEKKKEKNPAYFTLTLYGKEANFISHNLTMPVSHFTFSL